MEELNRVLLDRAPTLQTPNQDRIKASQGGDDNADNDAGSEPHDQDWCQRNERESVDGNRNAGDETVSPRQKMGDQPECECNACSGEKANQGGPERRC